MDMINFEEIEFGDNPDPRSPLVLLLDASSSMVEPRPGESRTPMEALNSGLDILVTELHKDPLAKRRVEVSVVTFGTEVSPATEFSTVENLVLPTLAPSGLTSMGKAVEVGLDALAERKETYKKNGIQYYRPWIFLVTDGLATDNIDEAARRIKELEASKGVAFFAVGVDGADMDALSKLSVRPPMMLNGLKFEELFQWLSASQSSVSASNPGDLVPLPSPEGWASV